MSRIFVSKRRQQRAGDSQLAGEAGSAFALSGVGVLGSANSNSERQNISPGAAFTQAVADHSFALPRKWYLVLKRGFDIAISLVALGIFGLFLPLLALIIKVDSPGSVFFSQERVGLNRRRFRSGFEGGERRKVLQPGRPFRIIKLRTMSVNAEANGPQWAAKNDVRVTRVGRFLRKTRLDEVPQFVNVLKGEMSLIGPRPERLVFVRQLEKEIPEYHQRLLVLPGITGLAQVINGYDEDLNSVRRKVELDREYIRRAGFRQDGRILLDTVGVVLKGEGSR